VSSWSRRTTTRWSPASCSASTTLRTADDDPAGARGEIDGLAAILESHVRWEERAVDGLQDPTLTRRELFG
jgi:hypothetical protein